MSRELINAATSTPFDRLFNLLVGSEKTGKSRLAATGRQSVFFFDFDGRFQSVAGMQNVFGITYRDKPLPGIQPMAFNDALRDLTKIEQSRSLKNLGFALVPGQNDTIKTIVLDSLYTLGKAARDYSIYTSKGLSREISVANMPVHVPLMDAWLADMDAVEKFVCRVLSIPDVDVIGIIHETQAKDPVLSEPGKAPRRTSKVDVYPERYRIIIKYFNEVWRIKRQMAGPPQIQFEPDAFFTASTNLDSEARTGANIASMIIAHLKKHPPVAISQQQKVLTA